MPMGMLTASIAAADCNRLSTPDITRSCCTLASAAASAIRSSPRSWRLPHTSLHLCHVSEASTCCTNLLCLPLHLTAVSALDHASDASAFCSMSCAVPQLVLTLLFSCLCWHVCSIPCLAHAWPPTAAMFVCGHGLAT